ncbi:hypothetical protein [Providencia sp. PROV130]|uniref:hypothetical protein n=1 Tax=Providencia sp. PROV130 TaxID=2949840 RepID=UPI00234AA4AC|nr:hypothetical protein [Providencia sp. PROV130]
MEFKHTSAPWKHTVRNANEIMTTFHGVTIGDVYLDITTANQKADSHLIAAAPELLEALIQAADYMWEDTRDVKFDGTMMFPGYLEFNLWEELHTKSGSFAIWDTGLGNGYHAYGGNDAIYWSKGFETRKEAQNAVIKHLIDIEPNHPAVLAHLAIAKALGQQ